jgi:hypothetical protein
LQQGPVSTGGGRGTSSSRGFVGKTTGPASTNAGIGGSGGGADIFHQTTPPMSRRRRSAMTTYFVFPP